MKPEISKLCIHTITTKPWDIHLAMDKYAEAGIAGITVWRQWIEGKNISKIGDALRDRNIEVVSLCRGGFFPASSAAGLGKAIEDNRKVIREAAELGAPMIVLVCGAIPRLPLETSRQQITNGIADLLPLVEEYCIKLAIEPLHPMYADDRSAINTLSSANDVCDQLNHPLVGVAVDVYHVWWDSDLKNQIERTAKNNRLFAFHISDWMTPTRDLLNDRGLMGEGCINIPGIRAMVEAHGFTGFNEVEIFSNRWWAANQDDFLASIKTAYLNHS